MAFIAIPVSVVLSLAGAALFFLGIERHFITAPAPHPENAVAV